MEKFNCKLYDKYKNLKKRKLLDAEEWIHRSNSAINNYQNETDGLIENLKDEKDRLQDELNALQDKYHESQKLNIEECQKNKVLSDEVQRLQNLLLQQNDHHNTIQRSPYTSPRLKSGNTGKGSSKENRQNLTGIQSDSQPLETSIIPYQTQTKEINVPDCCQNNKRSSGDVTSDGKLTCMYKSLMEYLVSMEISTDLQNDEIGLQATHQRSGYTFTLTLSTAEDGDEEVWYRVKTLGTIERIALAWMKSDMIIFSPDMLSKFFKEIHRVLGCS